MKNSRFGLQFVFRKPKGETRSLLPLYLRISAGGQRTEVSTRRSWQPDRWDATTGRAVGTREDARTLNAYLSALQARVYEVYLQLVNNHQDVTAEALKDGLSGVKKSGRTLIPIFQRHNEQLAKLVGAEFAPATLSRYQTALDHTVAFLQSRYQTDDISIDKLDYEFVTEYEFWLKSARKCGHNTAVKYISNLRKVVNICLKNGWLARDPFLGYKMTKREVMRAVLTQNEVDVLITSAILPSLAWGKLKTSGNFIWQYGSGKRRIDVEEYFVPGNNGASHPGKPVAKYSLEGEVLATYPSITLAAQAEKISINRISAAVNGRSKSAVGHFWRVIGN